MSGATFSLIVISASGATSSSSSDRFGFTWSFIFTHHLWLVKTADGEEEEEEGLSKWQHERQRVSRKRETPLRMASERMVDAMVEWFGQWPLQRFGWVNASVVAQAVCAGERVPFIGLAL